ncbi:MAG: plastocyanin/azurin family copper-binding protein [Actinomycetota bacterium]|nr:plastocyanin/azurin family copper-binding protein [Actinomycetota bacterium]
MRINRCLAAGAVVAAIALAGCGSAASATGSGSAPASQPASGAVQHVTLTGTSTLRFMPMTVHVHPGTVRVTLTDMGAYPHNVVIPALHLTSKTVTGDPGAGNVSFTVKFPHAGRYAFHCQYHQSAGMVGVFVVA